MTEFKRIPPEQAQALREQGAVVVDVPSGRLVHERFRLEHVRDLVGGDEDG